LAIEKGDLSALCGKNLDQLEIQEIPEPDCDSDGDTEIESTTKKVQVNDGSNVVVSDVEPDDSDDDIDVAGLESRRVPSDKRRGTKKKIK